MAKNELPSPQNAPSKVHCNLVHTKTYTSRGEKVEVYYNGDLLCTSIDPEHTACRILKERGLEGQVFFWREGKDNWDISMPINWGADHITIENNTSFRTGKYKKFEK